MYVWPYLLVGHSVRQWDWFGGCCPRNPWSSDWRYKCTIGLLVGICILVALTFLPTKSFLLIIGRIVLTTDNKPEPCRFFLFYELFALCASDIKTYQNVSSCFEWFNLELSAHIPQVIILLEGLSYLNEKLSVFQFQNGRISLLL